MIETRVATGTNRPTTDSSDPERVADRVAEIIYHEAQAVAKYEEAEEHRWTAAKLISDELASGKSGRQLAREIGKSHVHVNAMARVWKQIGGNHDYHERSFHEYYRAATGAASQDGKPRFRPMEGHGRRLDQRSPHTCPHCGYTWRVGIDGKIEPVDE